MSSRTWNWAALTLVAVLIANSAAHGQTLKGYWTFDGNANDSSGNGNNLTLAGGAGFSATVPAQIGSGQALNVTGGQRAEIVAPGTTVSGNYSVSVWARPTTTAGTLAFFGTRSGSDNSFDAKLAGGNTLHGDIGNGGGWFTTAADSNLAGGFSYAANAYHNYVYTVSPGGNYRAYQDGVMVGRGTFGAGTPLLWDGSHGIFVGACCGGGGEAFQGQIDDVGVYSSALTQSQVSALARGTTANKLGATGLAAKNTFQPIAVFSSGVDNSGAVLAPGVADPHWRQITLPGDTASANAPQATVISNHPAWLANDPTGTVGASFIGPLNPGTTTVNAAQYDYQTSFILGPSSGLDPTTAQINLRVATDNIIDRILLNGVDVTGSLAGYNAFNALSGNLVLSSGFVNGTNTLDILWTNQPPDGPGGLRVDIGGSARVLLTSLPEPGTIAIWTMLGLAGSGFAWRMRRKTMPVA